MDPLAEKLPYVVTLLFAAIGWGVTHIVDRVLNSPIVEYRTEVVEGSDRTTRTFVARLRNMSRDRAYTNLTVEFLLPPSSTGKFTTGTVDAKPPAAFGSRPPKMAGGSAKFDIPALFPSWEIALIANYTGDEIPELRLEKANPAPRLVRPSLETFLVDHEVKIILGAIVLWAGLILFLVVTRPSRRQIDR